MPIRPTHLRRLARVWEKNPVYFITTCTHQRRPVLSNMRAMQILVQEWSTASHRHGWFIGRFVIMPDHVHFFAAPNLKAKPLERFIAKWKEWTAKRLKESLGFSTPLWQERFFNHLLRSNESRREKWDYMCRNPVRAGLVAQPKHWPFQGSIHFE